MKMKEARLSAKNPWRSKMKFSKAQKLNIREIWAESCKMG